MRSMRKGILTVAILAAMVLGSASDGTAQATTQTPAQATAQAPGFSIVLGNDDGFDAPGLQALVKAFAGTVDLYVSAPAQNQSGKGHSITIAETIIVRERRLEGVTRAMSIEATPATAMRLGLEKFVGKRPDLVISGINRGENLGTAVYLSGTLGAAREAVFTGIPAIAVSMAGNAPEDYASTAQYIKRLVDDLRARQMLRPGFFVNVNAPAGTPKGTRITRLSVLASKQLYDCTSFVRERAACFSGYEQVKADGPDTDVQAFFEGYITVTPLTLDSTDAKAMGGLSVLAGVPVAK